MQNRRKTMVFLAGLALLIALFFSIWWLNRPPAQAGRKNIQVDVIHKDGSMREFNYRTDQEYLGPLLVSEGLIQGEESEFGLYVTWVDGEIADYSQDSGWWCLTQNGEMTTTGVSQVPVGDGDYFQWMYTIG